MGANLFKNAVEDNVGNSWTTVYTAPVTKTSYIIQLDVSCTGGTGVQISVRLHDVSASKTTFIVKDAPVPLGSSIQIIDGQKMVLESTDYIDVICDSAGEVVDVTISLIEDVN